MITIENLTKKFGEVTAVEGLTFQVKEGEVFGFLGPNGAGKTTTVRMLCCLILNTSGDARIDAYEIGKPADSLHIRKMIGLVPDTVGLYEDLTAFENLDFYGKLYECPEGRRKENIERFLKMLDLWDRKDTRAGSFSKGMKQKLALARALVHEPRILFLDEPTANLDPESSKTVRDFILEVKKQGRTIFLNTHNLDEAQRVCDPIGIIKTKLLTIGSPEQLRESLARPKIEVRLAEVSEALVDALRKKLPNKIEVSDRKLIIDVTDPDMENPVIVNAISSSGGQIREVGQVVPTLEDVLSADREGDKMRISKAWIVAAKDIKVFFRKRYTIYSLVVFPVIIGIGLPFALNLVISRQGALLGTQHLTDLMNAFAFFFAIGASLIPTLLASYSLVGEKVEKSLEPLLASPITDSELLLGKGIGAFIPAIGSLYIGSIVFMALSDLFTHNTLGYYYFPNWTIGILLLILMPLLSVLSVEWSVIVSARATDPRAAQLQGILIGIPLYIIYVATEVGAIKLNTTTIWIISGAALIADIILFFLSTRTFQREEILTKWS